MSGPFLPNYLDFPVDDPKNLQRQLATFQNQASTQVNNRVIGLFQLHNVGNNDSQPSGERWFPTAAQSTTPQRLRDGFRLVVEVSDAAGLIVVHNIPLINQVVKLYGTFFDGTVWWPLPYVDLLSATNQINVSVSSTQIIVTKGGGAPPSISNGIVVLEYL